MVTPDVDPAHRSALRSAGAQLLEVPMVPLPTSLRRSSVLGAGSLMGRVWHAVFSKLLLWNLTQYEHVAFLDTDAIATEALTNAAQLFDACPAGHSMCAVRDALGRTALNNTMANAGFMIVRPSADVFADMMASLRRTTFHPKTTTPEQAFLSDFFADRAAAAAAAGGRVAEGLAGGRAVEGRAAAATAERLAGGGAAATGIAWLSAAFNWGCHDRWDAPAGMGLRPTQSHPLIWHACGPTKIVQAPLCRHPDEAPWGCDSPVLHRLQRLLLRANPCAWINGGDFPSPQLACEAHLSGEGLATCQWCGSALGCFPRDNRSAEGSWGDCSRYQNGSRLAVVRSQSGRPRLFRRKAARPSLRGRGGRFSPSKLFGVRLGGRGRGGRARGERGRGGRAEGGRGRSGRGHGERGRDGGGRSGMVPLPGFLPGSLRHSVPSRSRLSAGDCSSIGLRRCEHLEAWAEEGEARPQIQGKSFYMVLVDRFAVGASGGANAGGTHAAPCTGNRWCGGNLRGLIERLDYIAGMGFDCLWVSPVVGQVEAPNCTDVSDDASHCSPYHGYWPGDMYAIDRRFGTAADLRSLSRGLKRRGMCLVLDAVINHIGPVSTTAQLTRLRPFNRTAHLSMPNRAPSESFEEYARHPTPAIVQGGCNPGEERADCFSLAQREQGWFYSLPKLNHSNEEVLLEIDRWVRHVRSEFSVDAFRLDTAAYLPRASLERFRRAAGVPVYGEVTSGHVPHLVTYLARGDAHSPPPAPPAADRGSLATTATTATAATTPTTATTSPRTCA